MRIAAACILGAALVCAASASAASLKDGVATLRVTASDCSVKPSI